MRYLVTGGAGYVGSHLVALLVDQGHTVGVLDNLRQGHRAALPDGVRLVVAGIESDQAQELLADGPWDAVFHFASLSLVGESMQDPMMYFSQNVAGGIRLIDGCVKHGVTKFVLSSTANLFGNPERMPIDEGVSIQPGSP